MKTKPPNDDPAYVRGWNDAISAARAAAKDQAAYARHDDDCGDAETLDDFALHLKGMFK